MSGLNSRFAPGLEEFLNSCVPKAPYHVLSVAPHAHLAKSRRQLSQNDTARNAAGSPLLPLREKAGRPRAIVKAGDSHDLAQA
jgi:hypothetical protein